MRRIDELHLEFPFAGSRMLRGLLAAEGYRIGRRHVKTLMRRMGIEAFLSPSAHDQARAWPQDLSVTAARDGDHAAEPVWDDRHHLHPDGARLCLSGRCRLRLVLPPRTASTPWQRAFCVETLEEALARHGNRTSSIAIRVRSSRASPSPVCSPTTTLRSAWTARAPGATTCSSSGCGAASNTRGGVSARLRQRVRGPRLARLATRLLQSPTAAHASL